MALVVAVVVLYATTGALAAEPASLHGASTAPGGNLAAEVVPIRGLRAVLASIASTTGIEFVVDSQVPDIEMPTPDLNGQEAEGVLRRLLAGHDLLMHYAPETATGNLVLKGVWVRVPGSPSTLLRDDEARPVSGGGPEPGSPEIPPSTAAISGESAADAIETLDRALNAADENVRLQALLSAAGSAEPPSREMLEQMLSSDPSELVRRAALEALSIHPESDSQTLAAALERARGDDSALVREAALAIGGDPTASSPEQGDGLPEDPGVAEAPAAAGN
jgi:hypothetical protein